MKPPRRLTSEETAVWRKLAETVTPLQRRRSLPPSLTAESSPVSVPSVPKASSSPSPVSAKLPQPEPVKSAKRTHAPDAKLGLDSSWERRIAKGVLEPDFSLDLHGAGLDAAYVRLMHGLAQAKSMGARVVLVVTGRPRPVEAADRATARGAIRAKVGDWLAASEHASDIAAIRGAHRRHGGQGALYIVLKKRR